jgi:P pilus assembly chaperone PapD
MKKFFLTVMSIFGILFMPMYIVQAGIEVSPPSFHLDIPLGTHRTMTFQVVNKGNEPEEVNISYSDWYREPGGKYYYVPGGNVERSISKWIEITPKRFTLEPDGYMEVKFTISPPDSSHEPLEGSYWGMLLVEPMAKPSTSKGGLGLSIMIRYAIPIYVTISNTGSIQGQVTAFKYESSVTQEKKETLTLYVDFKNTGTRLIKANGYVEAFDARGKSLAKMAMTPNDMTVLPDETFRFEVPYQGPDLFPGNYLLLAVVDYGGRTLSGGQMKLTIREGD